jgi:hypothetical protein
MTITPETTNYMIGGFATFFAIFSIYIVSLFIRWNNLKRDKITLEELEKDKKGKS